MLCVSFWLPNAAWALVSDDGAEATLQVLNLKPNPGPEQLLPRFNWFKVASVSVLFGLCVAALAILAWLLRRAAAKPTTFRPDIWALEQLAQLRGGGDENSLSDRFSAATSILRAYVRMQFGLPAEHLTTIECNRIFTQRDGIPSGVREKLVELLRGADLIKFAAKEPSTADWIAFLRDAEEFIRATSAREKVG